MKCKKFKVALGIVSFIIIVFVFLSSYKWWECTQEMKSHQRDQEQFLKMYFDFLALQAEDEALMMEQLAQLEFPELDARYDSLVNLQEMATLNENFEALCNFPKTMKQANVLDYVSDSVYNHLKSSINKYYNCDLDITIYQVFPWCIYDNIGWLCEASAPLDGFEFLLISKDATDVFEITNLFGSSDWSVFTYEDSFKGDYYLAIGGPDPPLGKYGYLEAFRVADSLKFIKVDITDQIINDIKKEFCVYGTVDFEQYYSDSLDNTDWFYYSLP